MDVPQLNRWPHLPGLLSASVPAPRTAPRTGAEVGLSGSHRFWRYLLGLLGHMWLGSGSSFRRQWVGARAAFSG